MFWLQSFDGRFINSLFHYIYAKEELAMSVQDGFVELENYFGEINKMAKRKISGIEEVDEFEYNSYDCPSEEYEVELDTTFDSLDEGLE
jgi:hypothetical protein